MAFLDLAKSRYSCRAFSDKLVSKEDLDKILEAGRIAPTARNSQPQKIFVISKKEDLEKVDAITKCRYGAQTVLAVGFDKNVVYEIPSYELRNFGEIDNSIVITHMLLQAEELGIKSCWVGAYKHFEAEKLLGIPENVELTALVPLGYAAEAGTPSERHESRKPISETVEYL